MKLYTANKTETIAGKAWAIAPLVKIAEPDSGHNDGRGVRDTVITILAATVDLLSSSEPLNAKRIGNILNPEENERLARAIAAGGSGDPLKSDSYIEIFKNTYAYVSPRGICTVFSGSRAKDGTITPGERNTAVRPNGRAGWDIGQWGCTEQGRRHNIEIALTRHIQNEVGKSPYAHLCRVDWKKAINCSGMDQGCFITFQPELYRRPGGKGHGLKASEFVRDAMGEDAFIEHLKKQASDVIDAQLAHLEAMAAVDDAKERAREAFAAHGISIRVTVDHQKGLDAPRIGINHYGTPVGAFLMNANPGRGLQAYEGALARIETLIKDVETNPAGMRKKLAHLAPDSVRGQTCVVNTYLMNMLRHLTDNPEYELARLIAHKSRKWSSEDLSDLAGRPVDAEVRITLQGNEVRCEGYLGQQVSIKNKAVVIRKVSLPRTVIMGLAKTGNTMSISDIVSHPCIPDSRVQRVDITQASAGETIVLWPETDMHEIVSIQESRKAA